MAAMFFIKFVAICFFVLSCMNFVRSITFNTVVSLDRTKNFRSISEATTSAPSTPITQTNQLTVSSTFINDTCNKFKRDNLTSICIDVINSDSRQDLKSEVRGLFTIIINHSIATSTHNYLYLQNQIKRPDLDNKTRAVFHDCIEEYEFVIDILKSSLEKLLKNHDNDKGMNSNMSKAFSSVETCEYDFKDFVTEPPAWLAHYLTLRPLLGLSKGFANLL